MSFHDSPVLQTSTSAMIRSMMAAMSENAMKSAMTYTEHCGGKIVSPDDIILGLKHEVLFGSGAVMQKLFERLIDGDVLMDEHSDTKTRSFIASTLSYYPDFMKTMPKSELLSQVMEHDDDQGDDKSVDSDEEDLYVATDEEAHLDATHRVFPSQCTCNLCKSMNFAFENWDKWEPETPMEKIVHKAISR